MRLALRTGSGAGRLVKRHERRHDDLPLIEIALIGFAKPSIEIAP